MFGRYLFLYAGEPQPGLDCLRKLAEIGLHTPYSAAVHNGIAFANVQLGLLEDALDHSRKALAINPTYPATNRHLAAIFALTGDAKAAAEQLKVFNRLIPDETISKIRERVRMGDTEHALRYLEGLRLAGMPE
jgi:tetratricopeptide (TPR) repeat protein